MASQLPRKAVDAVLATMPVYPPPDPPGATRNELTRWHSDEYHDYYDTVLRGDNIAVRIYHRDGEVFAVKKEDGSGVPLNESDRAEAVERTKFIDLGVFMRDKVGLRLKVPTWVTGHTTSLSGISYRSKNADPPLYRRVFEAACHVYALIGGQEFSRTTYEVISETKALEACPKLRHYMGDSSLGIGHITNYWKRQKTIDKAVKTVYRENAKGEQVAKKKTIGDRKRVVIDRLVEAGALVVEVGTLSLELLVQEIDVTVWRWLNGCIEERGRELVADRFMRAMYRMFTDPPDWSVWDEYLVGKGYAGVTTYGTRTRLSYSTPNKRGKISCAKVVARQLLTREELGLDWNGQDLPDYHHQTQENHR